MTGPLWAGFPHFVSIGKNFTAGFSFLPLLLRLAFPAPCESFHPNPHGELKTSVPSA